MNNAEIDSRAAFEASMQERFSVLENLSIEPDGSYSDLDVQENWETWQAACRVMAIDWEIGREE